MQGREGHGQPCLDRVCPSTLETAPGDDEVADTSEEESSLPSTAAQEKAQIALLADVCRVYAFSMGVAEDVR